MMGLIAYVPYAAVGYCVAAVAADVWPTLRSSLTSASYPASRHGMDGQNNCGYTARSCVPPFDPVRNQAVQRSTTYCFNTATGQIEGSGPLDGISPPRGSYTIYTDEDGHETARVSVSGDNKMDLLVCHQPGGIYGTPTGGPGGGGEGTPGDEYCGPRRQTPPCGPQWRRADCPPGSLFRNNDPHRLRRKAARWG